MESSQRLAVDAYRALHISGCFVLPNPWDVGTAVYLHRLGFKALASTSAGVAFSHGRLDGPEAVSLEAMLEHLRQLSSATPLPVNADFMNGYASDPEGVVANVVTCVGTGVAGLSIEDSTGDQGHPLYDRERAVERIRAAKAAIDSTGIPVVLTGRCEAWLVGMSDPLPFVLERLTAYAEAGADCLYAPGVKDPAAISAIVRAVAPKPVNVLMSAPNPDLTVERLADLGVRRVSVGGALARVAWGAFMRAAKSIYETGTFDGLEGAANSADMTEALS